MACQSPLFVGLGTPPDPLELLTVRSCRVCKAKLRPGSVCCVIGRPFKGPCRVSYPMIPILTVGFSKRYSGTTVGTCGPGKETPHILPCILGIGTLKFLGSPVFVPSLNMSSNHLKARGRSDYVYFLTHRTRWSDNDMYLHMNNSIYYQLFDLIMNIYLIERCGFTPPSSPLIGLVVLSHCQVRYSEPSLNLLISMIAMIIFFASRIPSSH